MKEIAVIIPVYNGEKTLSSCFASVLSAGKRVSETIIVDDGSTDETLEIANNLAQEDNRITVIHTENRGCYAARVTGIKASVSPYIATIDVDDMYYPGALDMLADLLEQYDADIAMGSYREVSPTAQEEATSVEPIIREQTPEQMWPRIMKWKTQEFVCYAVTKLYKREMLQELIDKEGINQGEDVLLTCQAFINAKKTVETSAPVYKYFLNPGSLTHVSFGEGDVGLIHVWDTVVKIMSDKRQDLLPTAQYNRWRTDFTLITRLILVNDKKLDKKYKNDLVRWRLGLKEHWMDLVSPHAMPLDRELLVFCLRFFYTPTKIAMRMGRNLIRKETSVILHSGDK